MTINKSKKRILKKITAIFVIGWFTLVTPAASFAAEVTPTPTNSVGQSTGAPDSNGAPTCTGAGCGQGANQGVNQGVQQGGPTLEDLGAVQDENGNWVLPEGVEDTRQGANHDQSQSSSDINGSNTNTGSNSNNDVNVDTDSTTNNNVSNSSTDNTAVDATANTGVNTSNRNTGSTSTETGNANIGVTQVKNNNTSTINGASGLNVTGHNGDHEGDLELDFGSQTSTLSEGSSVKAINDNTGADSQNSVDINTRVEENNEVQNDGEINNRLDLEAITGQNETNENTGDGKIKTGDANISATLVNLLNTTVINGGLWVSVADIFGDLVGNITLPKLSALAEKLGISQKTLIDAANENTGSDSTNNIDIDATDIENTNINNDADIQTNVNAQAITGQNESSANTGGGDVKTGNGSVSASNISVANTTVEGGNWGLVIVNSFNRWLGFLIGDNGETRALSQDETLRRIQAQNSNTGAGSDNNVNVDLESERNTDVTNKALINNEVNASAITGQNKANKNTGQGNIETGDANVKASAVNLANTTVKDGSLFVAVVNVLGNWWGDMYYADKALSTGGGTEVAMSGSNSHTGANSENHVNVDIDRQHNTNVNNNADVSTVLNANVDTGSNTANRNTLGGSIKTGGAELALHAKTAANLTGIGGTSNLAVAVQGSNDTTGYNSENTITANVNNIKNIQITNDADVNNVFRADANTGNNEASKNTMGGNIETGAVDATVSIDNLINQVLQKIAGGGDTIVNVDLSNRLTGADSDNMNSVDISNMTLIDIINRGIINNIIDLFLNTGGNIASSNTQGGSISTGEVCITGHLFNDVNTYNALGLGVNSLNIDSDGNVNNDASFAATTGDNKMYKNTYADKNGKQNPCPVGDKPQPNPSPTPIPGIGGPGDGEGPGGGEEEPAPTGQEKDEDKKVPRVLASVDKPRIPGLGEAILKRFPVAGSEGIAQLMQGNSKSPWIPFIAISVPVLIAAYYLDRQKRTSLAS